MEDLESECYCEGVLLPPLKRNARSLGFVIMTGDEEREPPLSSCIDWGLASFSTGEVEILRRLGDFGRGGGIGSSLN